MVQCDAGRHGVTPPPFDLNGPERAFLEGRLREIS